MGKYDDKKVQLELSVNELGMILVELHEDLDFLADEPGEQDETYLVMMKLQKIHDDACDPCDLRSTSS